MSDDNDYPEWFMHFKKLCEMAVYLITPDDDTEGKWNLISHYQISRHPINTDTQGCRKDLNLYTC